MMMIESVIENLEIIVGTYEEFLLGYKVIQLENEEPSLIQSFANHSHRASVRSVASGGKFLASGGTDESILLYDMVARKEAGLLMQHNGNINCMEFSSNGSHLLSGSEDGSIGVCRAGSWQLEKLWGSAHKGSPVTSISVHPSGKLFLSVGPDGKIRTWNLVKGRLAYATVLCKPKEGRSVTQVLWSPDGETYAVVVGTRVEIFTVTAASVVHTIQLDKKVTCICFMEATVLCVATEEGDVIVHDIAEKMQITQFKAHEGRVRCMARYDDHWIITASSAGQIKLWRRKGEGKMREVCSTTTGCRITCLAAITSAPLEELTKDDIKLELCDLALSTATSSTSRKRPLGVITVEDESTVKPPLKKWRKQQKTVVEVSLDQSTSDAVDEEVPKKKKNRRKKKKATLPIAEDEEITLSNDEGECDEVPKTKSKKKKKLLDSSSNVETEKLTSKKLSKLRKSKKLDASTELTKKTTKTSPVVKSPKKQRLMKKMKRISRQSPE